MPIWKRAFTLADLDRLHADTAVEQLGIEFIGAGDDWLAARMPVDRRTVQPFRILHGGASALLAETVGSCAGNLCVPPETEYCVGLDINANHMRAASGGWVTGTARPLHLGRTTQVWEIRITDEKDRLVCMSRLTMSVLRRAQQHETTKQT